MASGRTAPGPDLLDDLCTRFILNVPASELESFEKFMFLVEQAHWFYEDFCRERNPQLKSLSLKEFTGLLFGHCPGLTPFKHLLDDIYNKFNRFKQSVPTMGAILLDPSMEKCLLVRGISQSHGWGFPKGKVAKDESDQDCAIREVKEETGLDISSRIRKDDYIEVHLGTKGDDGLRQQRCKLFIVQGIDETTCFLPTVKGEIGAFGWHIIEDLPATNEATRQVYLNAQGSRHRFHLVYPFVRQLRAWIKGKRRHEAQLQNGRGKHAKAAARAAANHSNQQLQSSVANANGGGVQPPQAPPVTVEKLVVPSSRPGQSWTDFHFQQEEILQQLQPT